jgi:hypothetical protein
MPIGLLCKEATSVSKEENKTIHNNREHKTKHKMRTKQQQST